MEKLIAACGIDCSECEARQATLANDNEKRTAVAAKWSQQYQAELTAESINCMGCMEPGVHFGHCNQCDYRACVRSKGLKTALNAATSPAKCLASSSVMFPLPKPIWRLLEAKTPLNRK